MLKFKKLPLTRFIPLLLLVSFFVLGQVTTPIHLHWMSVPEQNWYTEHQFFTGMIGFNVIADFLCILLSIAFILQGIRLFKTQKPSFSIGSVSLVSITLVILIRMTTWNTFRYNNALLGLLIILGVYVILGIWNILSNRKRVG